MFFKSLKKEILIFTLGLIIITIVITTLLGVFSTQNAGNNAQKATSDTLREQAKESLLQIAESAAQRQDLLFQQIRDDGSYITEYTQNIYNNPSAFTGNAYWNFDARVINKDGVNFNSESDVSTFFIPNFVVLDAKEKRNIELTANLDFIAPRMLDNKNIAAIYVVDNKSVTRYYPNIVLGKLAPPDYDSRTDVYYKVATENNPDKKIVWTPLYDDAAGRGPMITLAAPIYTKNGFWGVTGIDVFLTDISKTISEYKPIEGSYAFLIDNKGQTIAFPDKAYGDLLNGGKKEVEKSVNLNGVSSSEFSPILKEMTSGGKGFGAINSGEKELFIAYAPLSQTGFSLGIVAEGAVMLKASNDLQHEISGSIQNTVSTKVLPLSLLIILAASIIGLFFVNKIVKPILQLTHGAREIGSGNLDYYIKVESKNEIGDLADSFNQMGQSLKKSRQEIEQAYEVEKKARKDLEELDKTKDQFILTTQHHLRTPLTIIKGYLAVLKDDPTLSKDNQSAIDKVTDSTETLSKFVNELLQVTELKTKEKEKETNL